MNLEKDLRKRGELQAQAVQKKMELMNVLLIVKSFGKVAFFHVDAAPALYPDRV